MEITTSSVKDFFSTTINLVKNTKVGNDIYKSCLTQSGEVSQNPNLSGFIFEQNHESTLNFNAKQHHSEYNAKNLVPESARYQKNSMDIGIYQNNQGRAVKRYQAKCSNSAENAQRLFEHGDYRGQTKLVADGQESLIEGATNKITTPDGISSDSISYEKTKEMQAKIQSGNFKQIQRQEFIQGAGKIVGQYAVAGIVIEVTHEAIALFDDYKKGNITGEEYLKSILKSGAIGGTSGAITGAVMIPLTAALAAVGLAVPMVTVPVSFLVGAAIKNVVQNKVEEFEEEYPEGFFTYDDLREFAEQTMVVIADTAEFILNVAVAAGLIAVAATVEVAKGAVVVADQAIEVVGTAVETVAEPVVTGTVNAVANAAEDAKKSKTVLASTIIGGIIGLPGGIIGIVIGAYIGNWIGKTATGIVKAIIDAILFIIILIVAAIVIVLILFAIHS